MDTKDQENGAVPVRGDRRVARRPAVVRMMRGRLARIHADRLYLRIQSARSTAARVAVERGGGLSRNALCHNPCFDAWRRRVHGPNCYGAWRPIAPPPCRGHPLPPPCRGHLLGTFSAGPLTWPDRTAGTTCRRACAIFRPCDGRILPLANRPALPARDPAAPPRAPKSPRISRTRFPGTLFPAAVPFRRVASPPTPLGHYGAMHSSS